MVVTCPACSARYRLNPDKMKGRGAKITCPKCAHVFVVFADGSSGSASDGEANSSLPQEDTLRARLARRDFTTTNSALEALGLEGEVAATQTSNKIRVVAPGPRGSRKAVATLDTNQNLADAAAAAMAPSAGYDGPEIDDANTLDFRKVGIATWKVKVAIGLVYDFSDVATLKRYLEDKRVTTADLLSHNGKDWTVIGDIPDLDRHFIEVWKEAFVERQASDDPSEEKPSPKSSGAAALGGSGQMATMTSTGTHRQAPRRKRRSKEPKKVEKKGGHLRALLAVVLLIGAGFLLFGPKDLLSPAPPPEAPPQDSVAAPSPPISSEEQDRIRRGVREEVARQREQMIAEEKAASAIEAAEAIAAEEAEDTGPDFSKLVPVRPENQTTKIATRPSPEAQPLRPAPKGRGAAALMAPSARASAATSQANLSVQEDAGGSMWASQGQRALDSGNFGTAKAMFEKCVAKNAGAADCWVGLGRALERMGKQVEADRAFAQAEALGVRVNRADP